MVLGSYTTDETQRNQITASPLRATKEELADLPPALIITGEADVLRDEGKPMRSIYEQLAWKLPKHVCKESSMIL